MKLTNFPWSPTLAGLGAGITSFALAALGSGVVHLGPIGTCQVPTASRFDPVTGRVMADRHEANAAPSCSCCCGAHPTQTTATTPDDQPWLLTAIASKSPAPGALARWSCEDDFAGLSPTQVASADSEANDDLPTKLLVEQTSLHATGEGDALVSGLINRSPATGPLASLSGPTGSAWLAQGSGSSGGSPAFGSTGGGAAASPRGIEAVASPVAPALIFSPAALTDSLAFRLSDDAARPAPGGLMADGTQTTAATPSGLLAWTIPAATAANPVEFGPGSEPTPSSPTVVAAAIPEPASLVLTMIGIGLAGGVSWRHRPLRAACN